MLLFSEFPTEDLTVFSAFYPLNNKDISIPPLKKHISG